jgi:hypothetical protein
VVNNRGIPTPPLVTIGEDPVQQEDEQGLSFVLMWQDIQAVKAKLDELS